jgi:3-oxoacyl-[acyl-carrier-protein] synthase II
MTGFASVTAAGVLQGLPGPDWSVPLQLVSQWPTNGPRRACLVPPFRAADVVPGLRARRMDRLSVWAMVSAALALKEAGIEASSPDAARTGVVCGSALGCLDRTQEFLAAVVQNAAKADPILFPETLPNLVPGHVACKHGMRGPNLTVMAGALSGDVALVEAAAILAAGAADRVLVLAGDCLTRPVYEFYEAAGILDPACLDAGPSDVAPGRRQRVPGEGLVACVLETAESAAARGAPILGRYLGGWIGAIGRVRLGEAGAKAPLAAAGPAIYEEAGAQGEARGPASVDSDSCGMTMAAGRRLAQGSAVGLFGGTGLWNVAEALALCRASGARVVLATNVDTCRLQAAAIRVAGSVHP